MKPFAAVCGAFILCGIAACSSAPVPMITSVKPSPPAATPPPLPPAAAAPSSALTGFNPARIVAHKDGFQVVIGGQSRGSSVMTLTRDGANFRLVTDNMLPPVVLQSDNVLFNATTLMPVSYVSNGMIQGVEVNSNVTVANGRAKGTTQTPGPGGVKTTNVDMAISPEAISDDALFVLVPALDLADGFSMSCKTFDAMAGEIVPTTVKVTGRETVTVPAGTFETFRVEVQQKTASTMFITVATPHQLVMARLEGGQVELRLAK